MDVGIEHLVLRRAARREAQIAFHGVGVQEEMWRLNEKQARVFDEVADCAREEIAAGHVVGVENHHEIAIEA